MAGYIGSKASVTQVDGYNRTEADAEFVQVTGDTMTGALAVNGNLTVDTNTLFVDATSNNVGIGTSSPDAKLRVNSGTDLQARFSSVDGRGLAISTFTSAGTNNNGVIYNAGIDPDGQHVWQCGGTERMRIDPSGNLLVGTTVTPSSSSSGCSIEDGAMRTSFGAYTGAGTHIYFINGNGTVGTITSNGTSTAYNTSSDYRLKEDVQPMVGASDRLMALKPVNFAWKVDGSRVDGFLAHEAQEVVPECVTGEKDAVDDEGNPQYQGIDQSKIVPLLTAALQEALTEIAQLKADVAELKGATA